MTIQVDEHLLLRTYRPEDAPVLFQRVNENRTHLRTFLPWVDMTVKESDSDFFIRISNEQESSQKGMAMGIFLDGGLIGGIGMHQWNHELKNCQLGYWLLEKAQGKGYMLQCAAAFLDFLFDKLDMHKVEICFVPFNSRSGALAIKLHAKVEGVIRHNCRLHGAYEDTVVTGILSSEWRQNRSEIQAEIARRNY